jgi:hypothetical protein
MGDALEVLSTLPDAKTDLVFYHRQALMARHGSPRMMIAAIGGVVEIALAGWRCNE